MTKNDRSKLEAFSFLPDGVPRTEEQLFADIERGHVFRLADCYVKFLFGKQERAPLFLDLLNAVIYPGGERAFTTIQYVDREISPVRIDGKGSRLDLLCSLDDGEQVNVEFQVRVEPDYVKRSLYYWALLHGGQLEKGMLYWSVNRTISVNILGFDIFEDEHDFRNSYSIRNDRNGNPLCDDLSIIYIELKKYLLAMKSGRKPVNKLEKWLCYFAGLEGDEMTRVAESEPMIEQAVGMEKMFLMNYEQRLAYIMNLKTMMDEANHDASIERAAKEEGLKEGREEGLEQGRGEERLKMLHNLLDMGLDVEKISAVTGFSADEITNLNR